MLPRNSFPILSLRSRILWAALFGWLLFVPASTVSAQNQQSSQHPPSTSARTVIENFHATLLDVMKNAKTLGIQGRYRKLTPNVAEAYDLDRWIRLATGRYWRKANESQKQKLKAAFKQMSAATYATQFKSYSGEYFRTVGERPGPHNSVLVQTEIVKKNKEPVGLTYVVFKVKNQWRIVDILLDNKISQLAVRRSEYRNLLKTSGIDGLIAKLQETTAKLLAG